LGRNAISKIFDMTIKIAVSLPIVNCVSGRMKQSENTKVIHEGSWKNQQNWSRQKVAATIA
jgi:hypothetical protein